jgi:hypothetical protein
MSAFNRSIEELLRAHPKAIGIFQAHQQVCTQLGRELIRKTFLPYFDNPLLQSFDGGQNDDYNDEPETDIYEISGGAVNEAEADEAAFAQFWQQLHAEEITEEYDTDTPAELTSEGQPRLKASGLHTQMEELIRAVNQLEKTVGSRFLISIFGRNIIITLKGNDYSLI